MRKLCISLVLAAGLVAVTGSCTKTATNEHAEGAETEQAEAKTKTTFEFTTVTTSKGTYNIKMVMKRMYKEGHTLGKDKKAQHDKSPEMNPKEKALEGAENVFSKQWQIYYGKPVNDEAKAVYDQAREYFFKGLEDGWNS